MPVLSGVSSGEWLCLAILLLCPCTPPLWSSSRAKGGEPYLQILINYVEKKLSLVIKSTLYRILELKHITATF